MTDEMLKYYQNLAIQKMSGDWDLGDEGYFQGCYYIVTGNTDILEMYKLDGVELESQYMPEMVWIPKAIDGDPNGSEDEKRRWKRSLYGILLETCFAIRIWGNSQQTYVELLNAEGFQFGRQCEASPQESLLKAIWAQSQEVEK